METQNEKISDSVIPIIKKLMEENPKKEEVFAEFLSIILGKHVESFEQLLNDISFFKQFA